MKLVKASPRREQGSEVRKLNEISCCEAPPPDVWVCTECAQRVHGWLGPTQPLTCSHSAAQSCPTLCDSMNCSPPGSCVHGILQARILEWVAMPSSRGSFWPRDPTRISCGSCIGRRTSLPLSLLRSPPLSPTEDQTVTQSDPEARLLSHLLAMPLWASYFTTLCLSFFIHNTGIVVLVATYPVGLL